MSDTDWEQYAKSTPHDHNSYTELPQMERVLKVIDRIGPAPQRVLDVGSSDGYPALLMSKAGHDVHCVDISESRIRRVKEKYGLDGTVSDGNPLPFEDGDFNVCVLAEVLEHTDNPGGLLAEAVRVVGPMGKVIITPPMNGWADPTHLWRISVDMLGRQNPAEPTKGQQAVITWRGGVCWPQDYWRHDDDWHQAFMEGMG